MMTNESVMVEMGFDDAREALLEVLLENDIMTEACRRGFTAWLTELGVIVDTTGNGIVARRGGARDRVDATVVPLDWVTDQDRTHPVFAGNLALRRREVSNATTLSLMGSFQLTHPAVGALRHQPAGAFYDLESAAAKSAAHALLTTLAGELERHTHRAVAP